MKKKNDEKKKKKERLQKRNWIAYCPFSQFESRYNFCIVTQGSTARSRPRGLSHDTAETGHDMPKGGHNTAWLGVSVAIRSIVS